MRIGDAAIEVELKAQRAAQPKKAAVAAPPAVEAPVRQAPAAPPVEIRKIESVTRQIDSFLRSINKSLQFRVDQATGEMVVTIRDDETGEVIRQVPGEDALRIAQRIEEKLSALLDEKA
jgi:flagellar protein FlaG